MGLKFHRPAGMSRRDFAAELGTWGAAAGLSPLVIRALTAYGEDYEVEADQEKFVADVDPVTGKVVCVPPANMKEVDKRFYETMPENKAVKCYVCARNCYLPEGKTCRCYVRKNHGGKLMTHAWNNPCDIQPNRPVEIGPLCHYLPGTLMLTVACAGCMLRCLYCQNFQMSQKKPEWTKNYQCTSEELIQRAQMRGASQTIAYTFTDPISFYDYMVACATEAKKVGLNNVMVTSGYINEEPLKALFPLMDAFTITLKGFTEKFYVKICGAELAPILKAMKTVKKAEKWLEVPILLVPGYNDKPELIKDMCKWIGDNLGEHTPVHFARFDPKYKMRNVQPTPINTLKDARECGMKVGLKYVYIQNLPGEGGNTYCHKCGKMLIRRIGVKILDCCIKNGKCPKCRRTIPGVWAKEEDDSDKKSTKKKSSRSSRRRRRRR